MNELGLLGVDEPDGLRKLEPEEVEKLAATFKPVQEGKFRKSLASL
jgi:hypothetical protein